jgi:hypothetical protein
MWLSFHINFSDGHDNTTNYFRLWIPTFENWGTIYMRLDIVLNPDTQILSVNPVIRHRRGLEHVFDDDIPDV